MDKIIDLIKSTLNWLNTSLNWSLDFRTTAGAVFLGLVVIVVFLMIRLIRVSHKYKKLRKHILGNNIQVVTKKGKKNIVTKEALKTTSKSGSVTNISED